jgi:hypothetical protein
MLLRFCFGIDWRSDMPCLSGGGTGIKEGRAKIRKSAPACSGHPERDDNRGTGANDGKGKLLSQVGDKN